MRTRSGSLAAVLARVPSHPAHSGMACICAERASSIRQTRRWVCRLVQHGGRLPRPFQRHGHLQTRHSVGIRCFCEPRRLASILALVLERWPSTTRMRTRLVGTAALILNVLGGRNTAVGAAAMVNNAGTLAGEGSFNGAVGAFSLNHNMTGFSNNAMGDSAMFRNTSRRCEYSCW